MSSEPLPLSGIRALEFCHTIMGPSAGMLLADLGADVIKVEAPDGDSTRRLGGFASGFFYAFNRNKRSLAVDLKSDEGRALIHRLAKNADVVLENYGPGTMDRLGCGYDDFAQINPRLVYCALKGFLSGPYEHRPALDEVVQFMAGLAYSGQAVTGRAPPPMPARESAWAIYETFTTADGEMIFIGLTSDNHWRRFCEHFGRKDLLENPDYATNRARAEARPTIRPIVSELVGRHTLAELTELFDRIGIPFSPVAKPGDLFDDPQLNAQGRMLEIDFPNGVSARIPRLPVEIGGHDLGLRRQAPAAIGQDTRTILAELGLSPVQIDDLCRRKVVGCGPD
jgi:crotonobetainyl-CoA:carnitine CoA-transferase CaiB-like acyl-CoA transferase